jgi:hypothetical protein
LENEAVILFGKKSCPVVPSPFGLIAAKLQNRIRGPLQQMGRELFVEGSRATNGIEGAASSSVPAPTIHYFLYSG